jgi:hypothetical protein
MMHLIGLVLVLCAPAADSEATPPGAVEELLRQQYAALSQIQFGRVVLRVLSSQGKSIAEAETGPPDPNDFTHFRYEVEFHGERFRVHRVDLHGQHEEQLRIVTPDYVINVGPDHTAIMSHEITSRVHTHEVFDPRLLCVAVNCVSILSHHGLEETVLINDVQTGNVRDVVLNGVTVKHVSIDRLIGNNVQRWIDPQRGHSSLKSLITSRPLKKGYSTAIVERSIREYSPGIWFPSAIHFRSEYDGRVNNEEQVEVESADFTTPPAEERFSLAGIGLSPGDTVHQNGKPLVWNGRELFDPVSAPPDPPRQMPSSQPVWWRWIFLVNAVFLGGCALTLAIRRIRSQRVT